MQARELYHHKYEARMHEWDARLEVFEAQAAWHELKSAAEGAYDALNRLKTH